MGRSHRPAIPLDIYEFGDALIRTRDLDPVYCSLHDAGLDREQLARLLIAYFYFYHLGLSAWLSEQDDFWGACLIAAQNAVLSPLNGRWPRGVERRHFRGQKAVEAIRYQSRTEPLKLVQELAGLRTLYAITERISQWPLCGRWISFKAADLIDRVWGTPIEFPSDVCVLYEEPRAALLLRAPQAPEKELKRLVSYFGKYKAPPVGDRPTDVSEAETILCKWKSTVNGHYWIGKDIQEMRHGLKGWGATSDRLLRCAPLEVCRPGELF